MQSRMISNNEKNSEKKCHLLEALFMYEDTKVTAQIHQSNSNIFHHIPVVRPHIKMK